MTIQDKIRICRVLKGYSVEYMAIELGIDKSSYSRIERGSVRLDTMKLERIVRLLGIELEWLMCVGEITLDKIIQNENLISILSLENKLLREEIDNLKKKNLQNQK